MRIASAISSFDEREPGPIAGHSRASSLCPPRPDAREQRLRAGAPAPRSRSRPIFSHRSDEYVQDERAIGIFGQRRDRPPSYKHGSRRRASCRCRPIDRTRRGSRRTEAYSSQVFLPATAAGHGRRADGRAGSRSVSRSDLGSAGTPGPVGSNVHASDRNSSILAAARITAVVCRRARLIAAVAMAMSCATPSAIVVRIATAIRTSTRLTPSASKI